jgi:hypothetical protein
VRIPRRRDITTEAITLSPLRLENRESDATESARAHGGKAHAFQRDRC